MSIYYVQFLDSSFPGQSDEDDLRAPTTPARMLSGPSFKVHYIPRDPSTYAALERYLFSIKIDGSTVAGLRMNAAAGQMQLHNGGAAIVIGGMVYAAGAHLTFEISATELVLSGFVHGDGTYGFFGWELTDNEWRLGGDVLADGKSARGHVSLPYPI